MSASVIGAQAVLIRLSDGTGVLLTLDQLISLGVPRFLMPDEASEQKAPRGSLQRPGSQRPCPQPPGSG